MPIAIFTGGLGSGKTVSMIRQMLNVTDSKTKIKANIKLDKTTFKNYETLTRQDVENYRNWEYNNTVIGLDELHTILDSRRSNNPINLTMGYWFTQSRKRQVNIYGTTQFYHQIDRRIRDVTDYIINCQKIEVPNTKSDYLNEDGIPTDFWIKQSIIDNTTQRLLRKEIFLSNEYFNLYDTYEVVDFQNIKNITLGKITNYLRKNFNEMEMKIVMRFIKRNKKVIKRE